MPEVEEAFEEIEVDAPLVGIIMGSTNDKPKMQPAGEALQERRDPLRGAGDERPPRPRAGRASTATHARMRGLRVIIAGAGMSAALPGRRRRAHRPAGDRRADLGQEPRRARRAALGRADAARRAGRLRGDRRRQERRPARGPDHQLLRPRDPPLHPRRRSAPSGPTQRRMEAWLEVELAATDAWAAEGVVPAEAAEACRERALVHGRGGRGARADDRPRRRRLRRRRRGVDRRRRGAGSTTASPPPTCSTPRSRCSCARPGEIVVAGARAYRDALVDRALRAPRHPLRRAAPTASTPSRPPSGCKLAGFAFEADRNLRPPRATPSSSSPSASSRARSAPTPRCRRRSSARVMERARPARARTSRPRSSRATATPSC